MSEALKIFGVPEKEVDVFEKIFTGIADIDHTGSKIMKFRGNLLNNRRVILEDTWMWGPRSANRNVELVV